jgi:hypothetical protein
MTDVKTFKLSRVHAEGWNAASRLSAEESDSLNSRDVAALNPYATEPERTRWREGFVKGLRK